MNLIKKAIFISIILVFLVSSSFAQNETQVNAPPVIEKIEIHKLTPLENGGYTGVTIKTISNGGSVEVEPGMLLDPMIFFHDDGNGEYFEYNLYDPLGNLVCHGKGPSHPYEGVAFSCDNPDGSFGLNVTGVNYGTYTGTICDSPGNCVNVSFTLEEKGPETICRDSDGGKNYYQIGSVTYGNPQNPAVNTDYCKNDITLVEHYCDGSNYKSTEYNCPNGCYNGACLRNETENKKPVAYIYSITPNPASLNDVITFSGYGKDLDGYIVSYKWDTKDGIFLSYSSKFKIPASYLGVGNHTIQFRVVDNNGAVSEYVTRDLIINPTESELKFDVSTDKNRYIPGENVEISATLIGDPNLDLKNADVTACVTPPGIENCRLVKLEPIGGIAPVCIVPENGSEPICPNEKGYMFKGTYRLSEGSSLGTYTVTASSFLNGITKTAKTRFSVISEHIEGGVDVEIEPHEQTTTIGKLVQYKIIIHDKHGAAMEGPVKYYKYNIEVRGLPYNVRYKSPVSIVSGGSKEVYLWVYPSTTKTSMVKEEIVSREAKGVVVSNEVRTITPLRRVTKVSTNQPKTSPSPTSGLEEVAVEGNATPVESVNLRFTVKVTQVDDEQNSDSVVGILHVNYVVSPTPPPFPIEGERVDIPIYPGWNLINFPGSLLSIRSDCGKPYGFVYLQDEHRYISIQDAIEKFGEAELMKYLSTHSFWIYSDKKCEINTIVKEYSSYSNLKLYEGWNMVGVTKDMVGETLSSINNDCQFESAYIWDVNSQSWSPIGTEFLFDTPYRGIIVKVSNNCSLAKNVILPPPFPEEQ